MKSFLSSNITFTFFLVIFGLLLVFKNVHNSVQTVQTAIDSAEIEFLNHFNRYLTINTALLDTNTRSQDTYQQIISLQETLPEYANDTNVYIQHADQIHDLYTALPDPKLQSLIHDVTYAKTQLQTHRNYLTELKQSSLYSSILPPETSSSVQ